MSNSENVPKNVDYNFVITVIFIAVLIIVRICIRNYQRQNIVIGWINFFGMFYILWRIYFQISVFLKKRIEKSVLFKKQYKKFRQFAFLLICFLVLVMIIYSFALKLNENFYVVGSCINDIISLCALLFSIEDEKIICYLKQHYRYK